MNSKNKLHNKNEKQNKTTVDWFKWVCRLLFKKKDLKMKCWGQRRGRVGSNWWNGTDASRSKVFSFNSVLHPFKTTVSGSFSVAFLSAFWRCISLILFRSFSASVWLRVRRRAGVRTIGSVARRKLNLIARQRFVSRLLSMHMVSPQK